MSKSELLMAIDAMKRDRNDVTVPAIVERAGVSKQAVYKWFKTGNISEENLRILAELYDADFTELSVNKRYVPLGHRNARRVSATAHDVPLIDWREAAEWGYIVREPQDKEASSMVSTTRRVSSSSFAVEVQDDSMQSPTGESFPPGCLLVVDPEATAKHGSKVLATVNQSGDITFKQLVIDGGTRYLKPLNPRYPLIEFTDSTRIVGVVVQMLFDVD